MFCPVCHALPTSSFLISAAGTSKFQIAGRDDHGGGQQRLLHCGCCMVDFMPSIDAINLDADREAQALVNYDFYRSQFSDENFQSVLHDNQAIIDCFQRFFCNRGTYLEIGAGLGLLTRVAAKIFETAFGLDLEVETAKNIGRIPENLMFYEHFGFVADPLPSLSIDAVAAWHVLEHFPDPHCALQPILARISDRGVFFGQIPMLRADYVIKSHYVFYNEMSLIRLMDAYGLKPVYFERDEQNDFLSFCFRNI